MSSTTTARRIVVLQADRIHGELICRQIKALWRNSGVQVFQRGRDALESIQESIPDLFITGLTTDDGGVLRHVQTLPEKKLPILVLASGEDACSFPELRTLRCDGVFDVATEGMGNLPFVIEEVMEHQLYISASMVPHMRRRRTSRSK
jgi:hypothetical protein